MRIRRAAVVGGMYVGSLAANQAVLSASGQKDGVNFFDPTRGDWLQHKWNGTTMAMGTSQQYLGFLARVAKDLYQSDERKVAADTFYFAKGKANPAIGLGLELAMRKDYSGRALPFADQKAKDAAKRAGRETLGWPEYLWSQGPIPVEGIAKDFYESARKNGADDKTARAALDAILKAPLELSGFRLGKTPKPAKKKGGGYIVP